MNTEVAEEPDETEAFRAQVRTFLAEHLDDELRAAARLTIGAFSDIDVSQRWYKILAKQGWIAPTWPVEHGGTGWNAQQRYIFAMECYHAGAPLLFNGGIRHLGPVLMAHGSEAQKAHYLPRILSGEDLWCQGYSEPTAGSDLARLMLSAVCEDHEYVLNGSKLWTTGAHVSTHMFCLARTSMQGPLQAGVTFLLLPMDSPGLTVDPIISISGEHELNQVFFDNVRVPLENRVGAENAGWRVAKVLMQFARSNNVNTGWVREKLRQLSILSSTESNGFGATLADDLDFSTRLHEADIALQAVEAMEMRVMSATAKDGSPGAFSSMLKTRGSEVKQLVTELSALAAAHYGLPFQPCALNPLASDTFVGKRGHVTAMPSYLTERAATIYSGSSEVQRDVLAKRVLGL